MKGVRIVDRMPQFVDGVQKKAAKAITQTLILGASEAAAITPVDTSNLLNSQYRNVTVTAGKITGVVGYTAEYALYVHKASGKLKGQPRAHFGKTRAGVEFGGGSLTGNYWDPSAEPQFLTKGFERAADNIHAVLTGAIKT